MDPRVRRREPETLCREAFSSQAMAVLHDSDTRPTTSLPRQPAPNVKMTSVCAGHRLAGAPRRNRTGDPILTMYPRPTAMLSSVLAGRRAPYAAQLWGGRRAPSRTQAGAPPPPPRSRSAPRVVQQPAPPPSDARIVTGPMARAGGRGPGLDVPWRTGKRPEDPGRCQRSSGACAARVGLMDRQMDRRVNACRRCGL
jgi:hypothetical protein